MGFSVLVTQEPEEGAFLVTVSVKLTNAESNRLFLAGDALVYWPSGERPGAREQDLASREEDFSTTASSPTPASFASGPAAVPFERTSMFISEVARLPEGLRLRYRQEEHALRVAGLLRRQLLEAGIWEEE